MLKRETVIVTPRLSLKPLSSKDARDVQRVTNHDQILNAISFLPDEFTVEDAASLISQFDDNNCYLGIWETQTTNLVGLFGVLRDAEKEVEVGYWIDVNCQGCGFASEALSHTISRLKRDLPDFDIVAHCAPDNQISRHVLVKHGFRQSQEAAKRPGRERFDLVQLD